MVFQWFFYMWTNGANGFSRFPGGFSLSFMVPGCLNPSWAPQARSETLRTPKRYSLHLYLGPTIPLGLAGRRPALAQWWWWWWEWIWCQAQYQLKKQVSWIFIGGAVRCHHDDDDVGSVFDGDAEDDLYWKSNEVLPWTKWWLWHSVSYLYFSWKTRENEKKNASHYINLKSDKFVLLMTMR